MLHAEITRNTQELKKKKETQAPRETSGKKIEPWSNREIQSFLQEWEFLEHKVHLKMRNRNQVLSKAIAQELKCRGIKKSWRRCFHMLTSLQDLHWTFHEANQRPRSKPLPCPFGKALQRILGYKRDNTVSSGPPCAVVYELPPPRLKAWTIHESLEELLRAPQHGISVEDPQIPGWDPWTSNIPWLSPCLFPGFLPADPTPQ
ncbi:uncharacterized protein MSANTD5 [Dugong dugon]